LIKLRKILLCDYLYYVVLLFCILSFLICSVKDYGYKESTNIFKVIDIKKKDDKRVLILKGKHKITATLYDNVYNSSISLGDNIKIKYEENIIESPSLPGEFNYKKYLYSKKIYKSIKVTKVENVYSNMNILYKIKNRMLSRIEKMPKSKGYLYSLIFGDNSYINEKVLKSYRSNGISHLFAISGLHISIFTGLLYKLLRGIKEEKRQNIVIIFLIFYMFITGFSYSCMRGCIFSILIILNKKYYFFIKPINLLLLTLSIIMTINPLSIYNVGLLYSFTCTFFLIKYSHIIGRKYKLLKASVIALLGSLPITINNFYEINFMSIFYNIIFVPFISVIFLPLILLTYLFPFLDSFTYIFIVILEKLSLLLTHIKAFSFSFCKMNASTIVIYYVSIFYILKSVNIKKVLIIILLIISLHIMPFNKNNEVTYFDIGQGDSTLLYVNRHAVLIDTGGLVMYTDKPFTYPITDNKVIPYMKSKGIKKITALVISHGDYDHMGEAINLVNNFKVEKVIFNCGTYNSLEKELIKVLDKKNIKYYSCISELNIDKNKLYFLQTRVYDNENDNSNVIYTELDGYKSMFMGDASTTTEKEILSKYNLPDIDVLKVGHHGSKTSSGKEFINEINPKYSIISVGKNNRYGHPNKEVLNNLENSKIYRIDQDGSIMFKIKNNKLKIETCSP